MNELAQLNPDKSMFTPKELEKFNRLRRKEKILLQKKDVYTERLEMLNKQRLDSGLITQDHYEMRATQLLISDFTYIPMSSGEQLTSSGQTTLGSFVRRNSEETMQCLFEEERATTVRVSVSLQEEFETVAERSVEGEGSDKILNNVDCIEKRERRQSIEQMYDETESGKKTVDADEIGAL